MRLKSLVHHQRIDITEGGMTERAGQHADSFKSHGLPEPHRALVRTHNAVKLHGTEPTLAGAVQGIRTECPGYPATCRAHRCDVAAIGYMRPAAELIAPQKVRTEQPGAGIDGH